MDHPLEFTFLSLVLPLAVGLVVRPWALYARVST